MPEPAARRRLREAREQATAERLAAEARQRELVRWRLTLYAGAAATAAGTYGAVTASTGWETIAWTAVSWMLALLVGIGFSRYVEKRDSDG